MSGYGGGGHWPAGDPVERWTEREARIESLERATELRGRFGEAIQRGTGKRIYLPAEAELAMSERAFRASTRLEVEQAEERGEEATP